MWIGEHSAEKSLTIYRHCLIRGSNHPYLRVIIPIYNACSSIPESNLIFLFLMLAKTNDLKETMSRRHQNAPFHWKKINFSDRACLQPGQYSWKLTHIPEFDHVNSFFQQWEIGADAIWPSWFDYCQSPYNCWQVFTYSHCRYIQKFT